jgi:hypothetical protein
MRSQHFVALMVLAIGLLAFTEAKADYAGRYVKQDSAAEIREHGRDIEFSIASKVRTSGCGMEGVAKRSDGADAVYRFSDPSDNCVAQFEFVGGKLKVSAKECNAYCGVRAHGSMDGTYSKKSVK